MQQILLKIEIKFNIKINDLYVISICTNCIERKEYFMRLYGALTFCKDSVLRIESDNSDKTINYPLLDIQNLFKEPDLYILSYLDSLIRIEKGATLSNIIIALRPWSVVLSYLFKKDLEAYCKACFSLSTANNEFDYINILKYQVFTRKYEYEDISESNSLIDFMMNNSGRPTPFFNNESSIGCTGYLNNDETNYSTSDIAFNRLKNIPLVLNKTTRHYFYFDTSDDPIFNKNILGVEQEKGENSLHYSAFIDEADTCFTLKDLLDALFIDILNYETPMTEDEQDSFTNSLLLAKEKIEEDIKNSKNVSPLKLVKEDDLNDGNQDINKDKTLVLTSGFVSDVSTFLSENEDNWTFIYENLKSFSDLIIGEIPE